MKRNAKTPRQVAMQEENLGGLFVSCFLTIGLITFMFTPFSVNLDEIKVTLTYFLCPWLLVLYVYLRCVQKMRLLPIPSTVLIPLAGYLVVLVISTVFARSFVRWRSLIIIGYHFAVLGLFFPFSSLGWGRWLRRTAFMFVLIVLAVNLLGFLHYGGFYNLVWDKMLHRMLRGPLDYLGNMVYTLQKAQADLMSTILNRDFYGGYLLLFFPLALAGFIIFEQTYKRLICLATMALSAASLFLVFSKDTIGAFVLCMVIFGFFYLRYAKYRELHIPHLSLWIIGIVVVTGTLMFFSSPMMVQKFKGLDVVVTARSIIWYGALRMFFSSPLIGTGPGSFVLLFPELRRPDYFHYDISHVTLYAHNRFLDLLGENGILGFVAYMAFMGFIFYYGMRQFFRDPERERAVWQLALLVGLFGLLLNNINSTSMRWVVVGTNFWAMLGLSLANSTQFALAEKREPVRAARLRAGVPVLLMTLAIFFAVVSSVYAIRYFVGAFHNNKGVVFSNELVKRYDLAIPEFQKALKANPTFITSYYKLAHAYNRLGKHEEALKAYKRLQHYAPDYAEIHFNLGVVHMMLRQGEEAEKEFLTAARMQDSVTTKRAAGDISASMGRYEQAKEFYENALKIEPDNKELAEKLVTVSMIVRDYTTAETWLRKLFERYPGEDEYFLKLGHLYVRLKNDEKLQELARQRLTIDPVDPLARYMIGEFLYRAGEFQRALEELKKAEQLFQNFPNTQGLQSLYFLMGQVYQKMGEQEKALDYFRKTLDLDDKTSYGLSAQKLIKQVEASVTPESTPTTAPTPAPAPPPQAPQP